MGSDDCITFLLVEKSACLVRQADFLSIDYILLDNHSTASHLPVDIQKERQLQQAIVHIKNQYGKDAVLKAMNILDKATARKRHQLIGGHNAQ